MVHSIARSLRGTGWHAVPSRLALLSLVLIAAACADSAAPGSPGEPISMSLSGQVEDDSTPSQMAVAALVPGFGGYFLDPSGAPTVYLLDASQRPAAEAALGAAESVNPAQRDSARAVALRVLSQAAEEMVLLAPDDPLAAAVLRVQGQRGRQQNPEAASRSVVWY